MKKDILFLHGWGGSKYSWRPIVERLKTNFSVPAIDLPGFGNEPLNSVYSLDDYAKYIANYIRKKHLKEVVLVGHSFGGAVAARTVLNYPNLVNTLVLVDAACIRYPISFSQKCRSTLSKIFKPILRINFVRSGLYYLLRLQNVDYYQIKNPFLKKTFSKIIISDLSPYLNQISIPTLIFWGEKDKSTPIENAYIINKLIPRSKLIIYPNSSHFSYLENQEKFVGDLIKFIK